MIRKDRLVEEMVRRGQEFVSDKPEDLRRRMMSPDAFTAEIFFLPEGEVWKAAAGAYKRCGGHNPAAHYQTLHYLLIFSQRNPTTIWKPKRLGEPIMPDRSRGDSGNAPVK
jgi:hypothetical protein